MKKLAWSLGTVALIVPVVLLGRGAARRGEGTEQAGEIVRVTRRTIGSAVKATGVVKPRIGAEVKVGSRVSGVVARLHVRIGDTVTRGQLLAELDTRELDVPPRPGRRRPGRRESHPPVRAVRPGPEA